MESDLTAHEHLYLFKGMGCWFSILFKFIVHTVYNLVIDLIVSKNTLQV